MGNCWEILCVYIYIYINLIPCPLMALFWVLLRTRSPHRRLLCLKCSIVTSGYCPRALHQKRVTCALTVSTKKAVQHLNFNGGLAAFVYSIVSTSVLPTGQTFAFTGEFVERRWLFALESTLIFSVDSRFNKKTVSTSQWFQRSRFIASHSTPLS